MAVCLEAWELVLLLSDKGCQRLEPPGSTVRPSTSHHDSLVPAHMLLLRLHADGVEKIDPMWSSRIAGLCY